MSSPLVWLITGTSSGIGRDLVEAALRRGDKVIATARARSLPKLAPLKAQGAATLELDVVAPLDTLKDIAKQAVAIYGRVDVLVNNAGYVEVGALEESTPEETYNQFNTNVFGGLNVARAFLPYMRARKTGTVIWIGSVGGWTAIPNIGLYLATKYALRGISETLHLELSPLGLRSLIFEYGYFRTQLLDAGNIAPYNPRIADYDVVTQQANRALEAAHGRQPGDPKRAVEVMVDVVRGEGVVLRKMQEKGGSPPVVFQFGSDTYNVVKAKVEGVLRDMEEWKDVITSTDFPEGT